jgi:2-polyprenyl-3-methyl-5-hydroxy-6-metoxy-1,4-benzoquinol methylase
MDDSRYAGSELEVFAHAVNWKAYFRSHIAPYLRGDVAEVGAGIGGTTRVLCDGAQDSWVCLEPDPALAREIDVRALPSPTRCEVVVGDLHSLPADRLFDAILYVDVLEHIEDDRQELFQASAHLKVGGVVVVIAPAHQWLFTPFDAAIGHFRRYDKATLRAAVPAALVEETLIYLDSIGFFASGANRLLLKSAHPTLGQIRLWDTLMVPASRIVDRVLRYSAGRSILGIWRRTSKRP